MKVLVSELARRTGYSRQWLNRLADAGEIPGCRRKPSGRLEIFASPELDLWIEACHRKNFTTRARDPQLHVRAIQSCIRSAGNLVCALHALRARDKAEVREQISFIYKELKRFYGDG